MGRCLRLGLESPDITVVIAEMLAAHIIAMKIVGTMVPIPRVDLSEDLASRIKVSWGSECCGDQEAIKSDSEE
ncbi:hypothetical protein TNCV_2826981 [Trichonephila clavipes]|nr:hypothetical protein TNCV_2826981 [Trichonephila clavipes]